MSRFFATILAPVNKIQSIHESAPAVCSLKNILIGGPILREVIVALSKLHNISVIPEEPVRKRQLDGFGLPYSAPYPS